MKIFIGTIDICGLLPIYKKGFELNGHQASTGVVSTYNPYFNNKYDYYLNSYAETVSSRYSGHLMKSLSFRKAYFFERRNKQIYRKKIIDEIINNHDVFVFLWHGLSLDDSEYQLLKEKNKKIISIFVGTDIRYIKAFSQQFNIDAWKLPEDYKNEPIERTIKKIRTAEKYSDVILSVPDQSVLALKPYDHFQIPINLNEYKFNIPCRDIPLVVHAPNKPWLKGTDVIEKTIAQLKNEGIKFDFISIRDMKNNELKNVLSDADVLVDEIVLHGPGVLSFEAMTSGCAVATRYLENSPVCFRPPVLSVNAQNIYEKLKLLLTNKPMRIELAANARKYVEENNTAKKITADIIKKLSSGRAEEYDYYPTFLRDSYNSSDEAEIITINKWTEYTQSCSWYEKFVKHGKRNKFEF